MGIKTAIEYCDSSINPIMGCSGCELRREHCYAAQLCARYAGHKGWPTSFDQPEFFPGRMEKALGWSDLTGKVRPGRGAWLDRYPRVIFVNDLSDGFCPDVDPWQWLGTNMAAMDISPHIWLLLTKWPGRMHKFFEEHPSPIPNNFWLGTSVCRQQDEWRIEKLLQIPAAVRFVSCEPLLEKVRFHSKWLNGYHYESGPFTNEIRQVSNPKLDLIIAGGESGPGARPMDPDWARDIRDQCQKADVPFFFKQWGTYVDFTQVGGLSCRSLSGNRVKITGGTLNGQTFYAPYPWGALGPAVIKAGKKRAGRLLDGREWNEMP